MLSSLRQHLHNIFLRNAYLKLVAGILTISLYIWVGVDREVSRTVSVPVRVNVPQDVVLISKSLSRVTLTVRGKWSEVHRVNAEDFAPISVQVEKNDEDGVIPLSSDLVEAPPGVRVIAVRPNSMRIDLAHRLSKAVPVRADLRGQPPKGYTLDSVDLNPEQIQISGPEDALGTVENVTTEPVDVSGRTKSFRTDVRIRLPNPVVSYVDKEMVSLNIDISSQRTTKTLDNIPVFAVNTTRATDIHPDAVSITVKGPRELLQKLNKDSIQAFLNMKDEEGKAPGVFDKKVAVRNLPKELEVVSIHPTYFRVQIFEKPINTNGRENSEQSQAEQ
jgi:YbbR domain-containing protein